MRAWLGEVVGGSGKSETGAALALGIFTRECAGAGVERTAIGGRYDCGCAYLARRRPFLQGRARREGVSALL